MTKSMKIILGVVAFLPAVFLMCLPFIMIGFMFTPLVSLEDSLRIPLLILLLLILVAEVVFLTHLQRVPYLSHKDKWGWRLLLILLSVFVFPAYWYWMIWRTGEQYQVSEAYLAAIGSEGVQQFCYFSTPEHLASFVGKYIYIYTGKGAIALTPATLVIEFGPLQQGVPFAALTGLRIGEYSRRAKIIGLEYLDLTFTANGITRRIYLTPTISAFLPVWETNKIVRRWYEVLTERRAQGRPENDKVTLE